MAIPLRTRLFWTLVSTLQGPSMYQLPQDQVRAASDRRRRLTVLPGAFVFVGGTHRGATVQDRTAVLADGSTLPVRVYRPRDASGPVPVVLNFHGGGWTSGDPQQSQWWCSSVAAEAGVVVVSVDYRLAPEHVFPVAAEDCYGATVWVAEHADELGVDASRLAVMGDSAGGNLAAVVALMSRDRSGPAIALQVLIYPVVDLAASYPSEEENEFAPLLAKADLTGATGLYCLAEQASDPYASPLRAPSHAGLPPALIQTAQHDPLRDQGPAYAAALRADGVPVRLTNYIDAVHGYISIPGVVPAARQALAETVDVVRESLRTTSATPAI
jgi:acetyl esterase